MITDRDFEPRTMGIPCHVFEPRIKSETFSLFIITAYHSMSGIKALSEENNSKTQREM
jgi:hypothetical protein